LNLRLNVTSETTTSRSFYSDLSSSKAIAELRGAKYFISTEGESKHYNKRPPRQPWKGKTDFGNKKRDLLNLTCYKCQLKGHYARECINKKVHNITMFVGCAKIALCFPVIVDNIDHWNSTSKPKSIKNWFKRPVNVPHATNTAVGDPTNGNPNYKNINSRLQNYWL
jgi:hypothetical protein